LYVGFNLAGNFGKNGGEGRGEREGDNNIVNYPL